MTLGAASVTDAPWAHLRWGSSGPWVVLLHGIGGGSAGWAGVAPAIAAAGATVLALDFPGYGATPPIEAFSLGACAEGVRQLLDHLGVARAVLVGHSMGGMVAQELCARSPQRVQALVLASTSPAFGRPEGDWQREFIAARCAPLDAGLGMAALAEQLVPSLVAPGLPAERVAAAKASMAFVPEATYRRAIAALVGFDRRADLGAIGLPTLVITGEHDRTAPPEVARRMADKIRGSRCRIVAGAGHLLPIEQPAAFARELLDFLRPLLALHGAEHAA